MLLDHCQNTADPRAYVTPTGTPTPTPTPVRAPTPSSSRPPQATLPGSKVEQALAKIAEARALLQQSHDTCVKLHDEWAATQLELAESCARCVRLQGQLADAESRCLQLQRQLAEALLGP